MTVDIASLVSDNLDVWTTAVERKSGAARGGKGPNLYGIGRLRALILDLAVRGRLVPQNADDEPASLLLKRIEAEKRRLIVESGAKRDAQLARPRNWPFDLPESWAWTQIGWVTNYGETDKASPGDAADDTWVLELEDVERGTSRVLQRVRHSSRKFQSQKNRFRMGDVIYGKLRPYLDKVIVADEDGVCTTEMVPIRGYLDLEPEYLRLFLKAPYFIDLATNSTHGMNLPRLGTEKAREAPFALAPTAEQQRIVAKVEELMSLCDELEVESATAMGAHQALVEALLGTLIANTDDVELGVNWARLEGHFDTLFNTESSVDALKQTILELAVRGKLVPQDSADEAASALLKAVRKSGLDRGMKPKSHPNIPATDQPFDLPKGWCWERFDSLIDPAFPIAYGVLVPGADESDGVPFVRIADLSITDPSPLPEKAISPTVDAQFARTRLVGGEILMGVVGSIGKLGLAPASWAGANIARAICRIVPSPLLDKAYVLWLLQSRFMQDSFRGDTRTLAQPTLNIGLIRLAATPVPPVAEQQRIVAKISEMMALCEALQLCIGNAVDTKKYLADTIVEFAAA